MTTKKTKNKNRGRRFAALLTAAIVCAAALSGLVSCRKDKADEQQTTATASSGLAFSLTADRTGYVVSGIGTCGDDVVIPAEYQGKPVKEIKANAFSGCRELSGIRIPASVTKIGPSAFYGCVALTSVRLSEGLTSIGQYAFQGCTALTDVAIPDSVTSVGSGAFDGCTALRFRQYENGRYLGNDENPYRILVRAVNDGYAGCRIHEDARIIADSAFVDFGSLSTVTIPHGVTVIGQYAFSQCRALTSVTIPDSVTEIGYHAFSGCSSLVVLSIPASVTRLGYRAFSGCGGLVRIEAASGNPCFHSDGNCLIETSTGTLVAGCVNSVIPDDGSVTRIGAGAFYGCKDLADIVIPASVTSIGSYAFDGCTGLASVNLPAGVTEIGECAFRSCTSLTEVSLPENLTRLGYGAFSGCGGIGGTVTIPAGVTEIGGSAFFRCANLTGILLPEGVARIGGSAFSGCTSLTSVDLPDSVTEIGDYAFAGCSALAAVTFANTDGWHLEAPWFGCGVVDENGVDHVERWGGEVSDADVTDPAQNAVYLSETYADHRWFKE